MIRIAGPLTGSAGALAGAGLFSFLAGFAILATIIGLAVYVYVSIAYYMIFKKVKSGNEILALIPIVNLFAIPVLLWRVSGTPTWAIVVFWVVLVLSWIPFLGWLLALGTAALTVWWMWLLAEKRGQPGWVGLLASPVLSFVPVIGSIVELVFLGILAWSEKKLG